MTKFVPTEEMIYRMNEGARRGGEVTKALFKRDPSLPDGVCRREDGSYKARVKINGTMRARLGFATPEDAAKWRQRQVAAWKGRQIIKELG